MSVRVLTLAELGRRGSWAPSDFIYRRGQRVTLKTGEKVIVTGQDGEEVRVASVEHVPGSTTEIACALPRPVSVHDIGIPTPGRTGKGWR